MTPTIKTQIKQLQNHRFLASVFEEIKGLVCAPTYITMWCCTYKRKDDAKTGLKRALKRLGVTITTEDK